MATRSLASENQSPWAIVWRCLRDHIRLAVLLQYRRATDEQTDGQTHDDMQHIPHWHSVAR